MTTKARIRVWITKYALTQDVVTVEVEEPWATTPNMIRVVGKLSGYFHKPDWHTSKEAAEARVAQMVEAKRKSLRKSMAKLDALTITIPD